MPTTITVTADDIKRGVCGGPSCPVELACSRAFGGAHVSAGHNYIVRGTECIAMSEAVRRWIWDFDADRPVEPFTFELGEFEPITQGVSS